MENWNDFNIMVAIQYYEQLWKCNIEPEISELGIALSLLNFQVLDNQLSPLNQQ